MGVPRKMSESHWGTYFIWPFRWRGFFGGSRMSSKMVSLHFPAKNPQGRRDCGNKRQTGEQKSCCKWVGRWMSLKTVWNVGSVTGSNRWRSGTPAVRYLPLRSWQSCCTGWERCCTPGPCPSSPPLRFALSGRNRERTDDRVNWCLS